MYLFADTETTGIFNRAHPAGSAIQPHICQLGAQLVDDRERVVAEMNLLVKPANWGIPEEAERIHGISTAMCEQYGLPIATVIKLFAQFVKRCKLVVAHNFEFDKGMLWTELIRVQAANELSLFLECPSYCTMLGSTQVLKLPGRAGYKWPNLQEAHEHFCGTRFEGAHDAMEDVRACKRIFFAMKKLDLVVLPSITPPPSPPASEAAVEV